jgi:hypothetical protein
MTELSYHFRFGLGYLEMMSPHRWTGGSVTCTLAITVLAGIVGVWGCDAE